LSVENCRNLPEQNTAKIYTVFSIKDRRLLVLEN